MRDDSDKKKARIKFLQSAQSRVFLAIGIVIVIGIAVGWFIHYRSQEALNVGAASVAGAPDIASVPGAGHPSTEYVKTQTTANIQGEEAARKSATSFVPTITRPSFVGDPSEFGQAVTPTDTDISHKACEIKKVVLMYKPNPESCTPKNLELARTTGVTAEELLCQGCSCPALKLAGFTAGDLKRIGLTAEELKNCGFSLAQLVTAGFSAADLKQAGFDAKQLASAGFTPGELAAAGFSPAQIEAAGYTPEQLQQAGLSTPDGKAQCTVSQVEAMKAEGKTLADMRQAGCSDDVLRAAGLLPALPAPAPAPIPAGEKCNVEQLKKERESGVSATELRQQGCGLEALKAAGFSARALRAAGFTASQLKDAGFTATQLRDAGFSAAALKAAGFSAKQLKDAGFSAAELKNAGFSAGQLKDAGFSAAQLKDAGFSAAQLRNAGFSAAQLKAAGFSAAQLKNAGFSAGQLLAAGYSPAELKAAGFTAKQLREAGVSAAALRAAGFGANQLRPAGFTNGDLLRAGYTPTESGYQQPAAVVPPPTQASTPTPTPTPTPAVQAPILPSIGDDSMAAKLAKFQQQAQQQMDAQQRQNQIEQTQGLMMQEAQKFMVGWSNFANQSFQKAPEDKKSTEQSEAAQKAAATGPQGPIIKAGTVLFAVLTTGINSDEQSPIMAQVVTGPLKGSKLLGSFSRVNTRVLIQFNLLSNPHYVKTIPIDAVAIDPNTARTAISGQVNNHYLLRYGTLFASSFLEGISNAIINQGVTTDCAGGGGLFCVVKTSPLNTDQQIAVGLGKVGQSYAQYMGANFNTPPTIRVPSGSGIGILIMSDLTLPETEFVGAQ